MSAFTAEETQSMLDFYALIGHMSNAGLDGQLRTGELATKVRLLCGGVGEDVWRIAAQL